MNPNARRNRTAAPMPWLLIALVVFTTAAAVFATNDGERLMVLAVAEALIVVYFCVALRSSPKSRVRKAPNLDADTERRPSASNDSTWMRPSLPSKQ